MTRAIDLMPPMITTPTTIGHDQAEQPALALEERDDRGDLGEGLVRLEHVAAAERPADAADREEDGEELAERGLAVLGQTLGEIVHRAAGDGAVGIFVAVADAEDAFGELRRHAQEAGEDHPEGGAGAAQIDGDAHTRDVAEADRAGKGGRKRLEGGHLTGVLGVEIVAAHQLDRVLEAAELDEAEIEREDHGGDHQPADDQRKVGAEQRHRIEDGRDDRIDEGGDRIADRLIDADLLR